jgi:hypothetical protein
VGRIDCWPGSPKELPGAAHEEEVSAKYCSAKCKLQIVKTAGRVLVSLCLVLLGVHDGIGNDGNATDMTSKVLRFASG